MVKGDSSAADAPSTRGHWGSRIGFVLAAAGSAVGLGNIWKFPYITGENGGGLFVLTYLGCIAVVGIPVMIAEIMLGRMTQRAPVGAFQAMSGERSPWRHVGWMGVLTGFVILSYYSVVAGWSLHYIWLSLDNAFSGRTPAQIEATFAGLHGSPGLNLLWHAVFMAATVAIVLGGVRRGIEAAARVMMPALIGILCLLLIDAFFLEGFTKATVFLFEPRVEDFTGKSALEALGHSFFTLSLGMGAMLTYGSYLPRGSDVPRASVIISALDTLVALLACLVLFPILFTFGMEPQAGPGLVFKSIPIAFSQMTGGYLLSIIFFVLLFFAALTSAISLLEVCTSTFIDQLGWRRGRATLLMGGLIFAFGVPSALSGSSRLFGEQWAGVFFGKSFFDWWDYVAANWLLPLGGLLIAVYVGWVIPEARRREEFCGGSSWSRMYGAWRALVRYPAPVAIAGLFAYLLWKEIAG